MTELADVIKELRAWLEWLKKRGHTHMSIPIAEMHTWLEAAEKAERYEKLLRPTLVLLKDMRLTDLMLAENELGYDYTKLADRIEEAINPEGETK